MQNGGAEQERRSTSRDDFVDTLRFAHSWKRSYGSLELGWINPSDLDPDGNLPEHVLVRGRGETDLGWFRSQVSVDEDTNLVRDDDDWVALILQSQWAMFHAMASYTFDPDRPSCATPALRRDGKQIY